MKKVVSIVLLCLFSLSVLAQEEDVTRFLDIPVDGSQAEMIQKLNAKGFHINPHSNDVLSGEFNGEDVNICIGTNNNKVYRIMVADVNTRGERDIQIRFNRLCNQFKSNPKYTSLRDDQTIPDDENIAYEIAANNKRYQAYFYQNLIGTADPSEVTKYLTERYSAEQLVNLTDDEILSAASEYYAGKLMNKSVWFMICELHGEYFITMYYDNEYNHANGED